MRKTYKLKIELTDGSVQEVEFIASAENVNFTTDRTLSFIDRVLSVNTATVVEQNNSLPVTSAAVAAIVGDIEALLKTI